MTDFDLLILGGGIIGLTTANLFSKTGLQIAIVEPNTPKLIWDSNSYDLRVCAVAPSTKNILQNIGIWNDITQIRHGTYTSMQVWDSTGNGIINFHANDIYQKQLGFIIENRVMQSCLWQAAISKSNITHIKAKAERLLNEEQQVKLQADIGNISAKLIIGCDGTNSWLRNQLQIPCYHWQYCHNAIVATINTEKPHNNCAMQRFSPSGPLANLPLDNPYVSSIVWSTTNAEELISLNTEKFAKLLSAEFNNKLGEIELLGEKHSFALRMNHAKTYIGPRAAIAGDAAHVIHPLAGQGLNLGMLDIASLYDVIQKAHDRKQDIGDRQILRKYERWRIGHNTLMTSIVEGIKQLFGSSIPIVNRLRNAGLLVTDKNQFIKQEIIKTAIGAKGKIPTAAS